jgi:hypothetical protein
MHKSGFSIGCAASNTFRRAALMSAGRTLAESPKAKGSRAASKLSACERCGGALSARAKYCPSCRYPTAGNRFCCVSCHAVISTALGTGYVSSIREGTEQGHSFTYSCGECGEPHPRHHLDRARRRFVYIGILIVAALFIFFLHRFMPSNVTSLYGSTNRTSTLVGYLLADGLMIFIVGFLPALLVGLPLSFLLYATIGRPIVRKFEEQDCIKYRQVQTVR